jgi:hypothetical protein
MRLDQNHQLYKLSTRVDWPYLESELSHFFKDGKGAQHRFMAGMVYLKDIAELSSAEAIDQWEECPYWRYLCGGAAAVEITEYPYSPHLLDVWTRSLEGEGYEVLINALLRLPAGVVRKH